MLDVNGISRGPLQPTSLTLKAGACIAIRGVSGSGKSLLLRAIADLDPCDGTVTLDGMRRDDMPATVWRQNVTYVAAQAGWWAETVGAHFDDPDVAAPYFARFGLDPEAIDWPVSRLSSGESQRLALIRAIVQTPKVMLLDEPTSALDPEATAMIEGVLHEKLAAGCGIILVSHDAGQAKRMSPRQFVMRAGKLSEDAAGGA